MQTVYTSNTVDASTGELIQKTWITKKVKDTDHFVKMYIGDISALYKLPNAQHRLLVTLSEYLEYNTNEFFLNKQRREEIALKCNSTINTLNQGLARLIKKNIILKKASNVYQMNPLIFFNGEEMKRTKILEAVIRWEICDEC